MNIDIIYTALFYLSFASLLIPLAFGILKFKTLNLAFRVLFFYLLISAITEALSYLLTNRHLDAYFAVQNTFVLVEFLLLAIIYYLEFTSKLIRRIILFTSIIYLGITLKVLFESNNYLVDQSILSVIEASIMMVFAVYFFYKIQAEMIIPRLTNHPPFWINCAILIYFASAIILFIFDDYIIKCSLVEFQKLWSLHLISNIAYNVLFAIAIWKTRKR